MSLLEQLVEMGFDRAKVERALAAVGGEDIDQAIQWLTERQDEEAAGGGAAAAAAENAGASADKAAPADNAEAAADEAEATVAGGDEQMDVTQDVPAEVAAPAAAAGAAAEAEPVFVNLKCNDCGKVLASMNEAMLHAERSKHQNFGETTDEAAPPMSDEQKARRASQLAIRLNELRAKKLEEERKDAIAMEKRRRATGKEINEAKQRFKEQEMRQAAEERKRQRQEDAAYKQRLLDSIKRDRESRQERAEAQGGGGGVAQPDSEAAQQQPQAPVASSPPQPRLSYDSAKLSIRLPSGKSLTHVFGAGEPLSAVRLFVALNRPDRVASAAGSEDPSGLQFFTVHPRRDYTDGDMDTPLGELGLVPAAVLMTRVPGAV